jgi:class 3 adenylate cyclase/tetratricopeptide (TPR) repeat protein
MGVTHCADCGHRASERARFCERCGAALTPSAEPLRAPTALEARILAERTGIEGERKQVTVMYTDIVGSMELTRSLDSERWGFVLDRFLAISARAVHALEGTVNQFTGDGLLAVFGAPLAHEDHARRACLAVLELQREVAGLAAEVARRDGVRFAARCGLNSGEVIVGAIGDDVHMDFVPIGNTTALGKRIESLAPAGSVAISASTAALVAGEFQVRDLGEFEIKGAPAPQRVFELLGPGTAQTRLAAAAVTRGLSRFIGREGERAVLEQALEDALAGKGRAVAIVGDAGVGKSRLVHEFVAGCAARGLAANSAGCVAHGRYVPFLPMLALYRSFFGIAEHDPPASARERIRATTLALGPEFAADLPLLFELLGVPDPDQPLGPLDADARRQRLLEVLTGTIKARSRHEPVVVVIDDLQWIDDASAAVLGALVEAVADTRILVVANYRPEYEAAWTGREPHTQISLGPLNAGETDHLLTELLGHDGSLDGLAALIQARTAGNPFFVEEVVQALAEEGHLSGERGAYELAAQLDAVVLPATVQAGLAARIDRLPVREKALVQTMSVIGQAIPGPLLSEVSALGERQLADAVRILARAQIVIPHSRSGGHEYVFKHPLTQEVAYGSQLSDARARAHQTVAAAIERTYPHGLDERAALLAHHCEACGDMLAAASWHARAATWSAATSPADSMRHWRRVRHLTGPLDAAPERDALATKARIGILSLAWRLGGAAAETAALHAEAHADAERVVVDLYYAGSLMHGSREREALDGFRGASRAALATGDPGQILTASTGVAYASWVAGSLREGVDTIDHALPLVAGDPMAGSGLAFVSPLAHAHGHRGLCLGYMGELVRARQDFARAIALAREHGDPETESASHANLALLEATVGEYDAAVSHAALGLAFAEGTGNVVHTIACTVPLAAAAAGSGRSADALARAESALAAIRAHGVGEYYEPSLLATIARSKLALGRPDDALAAAEQAVDIADARGLATCALPAPIALAHVLTATRGPTAAERADAVLDRALGIARDSDARVFEAHAHRERAALARVLGDDAAAERARAQAHRILTAPRASGLTA